MQGAPPAGYPQGGYPDPQGANPAYDPQGAYHYPQQPAAAPQGQRPGFEGGPAGGEYAYPNTRPSYAGAQQPGPQQRGYAPAPGPDPLTAGYRPAGAPFGGQMRQPDPMGAAPGMDQWSNSVPTQDPRGYDLGSYMPAGAPHPEGGFQGEGGYQQPADWALPAHAGYGDPSQDPAYQGGQHGYEQPQNGALEQAYSEDGAEYEAEEPRRGSWALRIAGAIVVAVGLGYGLAQGYKMLLGTAPDGITPVVRGDSAPTKTKPAEPGGKQFAHTDSKVMGRLGEGASATTASLEASSPSGGDASPGSDSDNGARKVTTMVIGRDGSIVSPQASQPPPAEPGANAGSVAVPGVTMVDGFGGQYPGGAVSPTAAVASNQDAAKQTQAAARQPLVVNPPESSSPPVTVATTTPAESSPPAAPKAPAASRKPAAPTQQAAVAPEASSPAPSSTGATGTSASSAGASGYVVVLASVPASSGSRLVALKKFADMQQQYGSVLQNKTPDVREANLGQKGIYHRLLVGPPGSRSQASALCGELKTAGYKDCWVTAY